MEQVKRYTIKDIAMKAGVSPTTISRYLNGQFQYMSDETKERIGVIIEKYNYRPSLIARGLKREKSYLFGVVMPHIHNGLTSSSAIRGICRACSSTPYNPIIVSIEDDIENELSRMQQLTDHRVEGIISFTGCQHTIYKKLNKTGMPIVAVDRYYNKCGLDGVVIDHYTAVNKLFTHLVENGYTKIAMFTSENVPMPLSTISIREKAFVDFHNKHFKNSSRLIYRVSRDEVEDIKLKLMTLKSRFPSERIAVFVTDMMLLQIMDWAFKMIGMRYPDDMALCGYILREDIQDRFTPISTISQSLDFLAQRAFQLLIDRIDGVDLPFPQKILVPAELNIRASTMKVEKRL